MTAPSVLTDLPAATWRPPASRPLWCDRCNAWTEHTRVRDWHGARYTCKCGGTIIHFVTMRPQGQKVDAG